MADVFISHASSDVDGPTELDRALREAGFSVWWDAQLLPGQRYRQTLIDQLAAARVAVVIWSADAVTSDWVYSEATRASEQEKLVQVRSGAVAIADLPAPFDAFHCPPIDNGGAVVRAVAALLGRGDDPAFERAPASPATARRERLLPTVLTETVGREGELDELVRLMTPHTGGWSERLVTLTGPAGSGKTRLAVEVGRRLEDAFRDGVRFAPLEAVTDGANMWVALARALGPSAEATTKESVLAQLLDRQLLVILDNLEQLVDAGVVVRELLDHAPDVIVLATSRRPLHLSGEREYAVRPLAPPVTGASEESIDSSAAVRLFAQQARRVRRDFQLSDANRADVAEICRLLDGLPLAVELAASRVKLLSPAAVLARLDRALDLTTTSTEQPARQRTLRGAVEWSYRLLQAPHQELLRRLSVFGGGCDIVALEAVAGGAEWDDDPLEVAEALVEASLVRVSEGLAGEPRFSLLNTIRLFAMEELRSSGGYDEAARRHGQHFLDRATELRGATMRGESTRDRFVWEVDNFRELLDRAPRLRLTDPRDRQVVVSPLEVLGLVVGRAFAANEYMQAHAWLVERLGGGGTADDQDPGLALALAALATVECEVGDYEHALEDAGKATELAEAQLAEADRRASGSHWARPLDVAMMARMFLAASQAELGDLDAAYATACRVPLLAETANPANSDQAGMWLANAYGTLGDIAAARADLDAAEGWYLRSRDLDTESGDDWGALWCENALAGLDLRRGRPDAAARRLAGVATRVLTHGDQSLLAASTATLAHALVERDPRLAATGVGAADQWSEQSGQVAPGAELQLRDEVKRILRERLGQTAYDEAYRAGTSRPLADVLVELVAVVPVEDITSARP